jgi:hypothetical protein
LDWPFGETALAQRAEVVASRLGRNFTGTCGYERVMVRLRRVILACITALPVLIAPVALGAALSDADGQAVTKRAPVAMPTQVACAGEVFGIRNLDAPTGAERRGDAPARALARFLRSLDSTYPTRGYRVLRSGRGSVLFGAGHPPDLVVVVVRQLESGAWYGDQAGDCDALRAVRRGAEAASFRLAEQPGPKQTRLRLLVQEDACAGGMPATGRILAPGLREGRRRIVIALFTRPRASASCQSNPETPYTLYLRQPLGKRRVVDGSFVPGRTRRAPR